MNPTLVVEVLSPGAAASDRNEKLELYQSIDSLEEYLLVWSDEARVEKYTRHGDVWLYESVRGLDATIEIIGGPMRLADLYREVDLPPRPRTARS